jgi:hypothetical protein
MASEWVVVGPGHGGGAYSRDLGDEQTPFRM